MKKHVMEILIVFVAIFSAAAYAQDDAPKRTLFTNVNVFDGFADELAMDTDVLVEGNVIIEVGQGLSSEGATVIDGGGRTPVSYTHLRAHETDS